MSATEMILTTAVGVAKTLSFSAARTAMATAIGKRWAEHERLARETSVNAFERNVEETASFMVESLRESVVFDSMVGARLKEAFREALRDAAGPEDFQAHAALGAVEVLATESSAYHREVVKVIRQQLTWQERLVLAVLYPYVKSPMTYVEGTSVARFLRRSGVAVSDSDVMNMLQRLHRLDYIGGMNDSDTENVQVNIHGRHGIAYASLVSQGLSLDEDVDRGKPSTTPVAHD